MNFKSLLGNLFQKGDVHHQSAYDEGQPAPPPFVDVRFNSANAAEASLQKRWEEFARRRSAGVNEAEEALVHFADEFRRCFDGWVPEETVFTDARRLSWDSQRPPLTQAGIRHQATVYCSGCYGGHPKEVLQALVASLKQAPLLLAGQASTAERARRGTGAPVSYLSLLEALGVAARSRHNSRVILDAGLSEQLGRLLKVAVSRLNVLVAQSGVGDSSATAPLDDLLAQLEAVAAVLENLAKTQARAAADPASVPVMQHYLTERAEFCCPDVLEPGSRQEADAMAKALQPLLAAGAVTQLLHLLHLLGLLRSRGAAVAFSCEAALLRCLLVLISAGGSPAALLNGGGDGQAGGLPELAQRLAGGASQAESSAPDPTSDAAELRVRALVLQSIAAALKRSRANLQLFEEVGGFGAVMPLLLWTAAHFPCRPTAGSGVEFALEGEGPLQELSYPLDASASAKMPQSQALAEVFLVLESWLSLRELRSSGASQRQHWHRLCSHIVAAVTACFLGERPPHLASPALQHYSLAFIAHLLHAEPGLLPELLAQGLLDLLFSRTFFPIPARKPSSGHSSEETLRLELSLEEDTPRVSVNISVARTSAGGPVDGPEARLLRRRVVHLLERLARRDAGAGLEVSCRELLRLLREHVLEPEVVVLVGPALGRVLEHAPEEALPVLERLAVLPSLASSIKQQQLSAAGGQVAAGQSDFLQARFALLHLLAALLAGRPELQRSAVRNWDTVAAVFGLLRDAAMRGAALDVVVALMRMVPASEDEALAKAALFTKFVEVLPTALEEWQAAGLGMATDLLAAVRTVVAADRSTHQNLFRRAECFVQIISLLSLDYPPQPGCRLCCEVVATLTALLAGNEASRNAVRHDVGYDTLFHILTRLAPQPPRPLLLHLLGLALERDVEEGLQGLRVANVDAVALLFRCLRLASLPDQEHMLRIWHRLAAGNMANLAACDKAGVNSLLIDWLAASEDHSQLQVELTTLLRLTGSYSITGRDLRALLALLRPTDAAMPAHAPLLLKTLAVMAQHEGPAAFFDFADAGAGLMRTTALRFPGSRGYTFATWLRLERTRSDRAVAGQSVFALLATSGTVVKGVVSALRDGQLVVYCLGPKPAEACLDFRLQPERWYHVALTHSAGGPLTPSTLRLYVDGEQQCGARFRFPKVSEPADECSIGAGLTAHESGLGIPLAAFSGQMGCIYLFEDVLSPVQVAALCELGPDYQSTFMRTESDPAFDQAAAAAGVVVEGKEALGPLLLMSYNAQAAAGRMLYSTSDMNGGGGGGEGGTAAMLEGTQLCCTCQLRDILHCLGGVAVLLPLLSHLDLPSGADADPAQSRAVDVLRLFTAVLEESPSNRQSMLQISGVALMGQLLQQASPLHLTVQLLEAVERLCRACRPSQELWQDVLRHLLLNLGLWSRASVAPQRHLLHFLLNLAKAEPVVFRKLLGVPQLLDAVRAHYWTVPGPDAVRPPAGGGGSETRELRRGVLAIARLLLRQSAQPGHWRPKSSWADVQAFVSFVGDCGDVEALEDVLGALLEAMHRGSPSRPLLLACLRAHGGERLFMSLLQREQHSLRLLGLQLLAAFLGPQRADAGGGLEDMKRSGFWTSVSDLVLMFPLTPPLRAVLLEMLCVGSQPVQVKRPGGPAVPVISCAPVVSIFLRLLLGCEDASERLSTLEALHHLCVDGPPENRAAVVELHGWEEWFLELLLEPGQRLWRRHSGVKAGDADRALTHVNPSAEEGGQNDDRLGLDGPGWAWRGREAKLLRGMLRALFRHCISHVPDGWTSLEHAAFRLRELAGGRGTDAWALMHALLADVVSDLAGAAAPDSAAAAADAWTMVSSLAAQPARGNALGVLALVDQLLSGSLLQPDGVALHPLPQALAWAEGTSREEIPAPVWTSLALCKEAGPIPQVAWQLFDAVWQLVYLLQRAQEASASLQAPEPAPPQRELGSLQMLKASSLAGSLPFGIDRRLASLPVIGWQAGAKAEEQHQRPSGASLCLRLLSRLLLKYLLAASPANAQACVDHTLHLLPALLDISEPGQRGQIQLLLAAMSHALSHAGEERRLLQGSALLALLPGLEGVFTAEGLHVPQLPSLDDAQFPLVVEGWLQSGRAAEAARVEVLQMKRAAVEQLREQKSRAAAAAARQMQERQLRQNLQEDARQALGLIHESERSRRCSGRAAAEEEAQKLARSWRAAWRVLSGRGGVWSAAEGAEEVHWKLDKFEDPSRRRLRLKRNYKFQMYRQPAKLGAAQEPQEPPSLPDVKLRSRDEDDEDAAAESSPGQGGLQVASPRSQAGEAGLEEGPQTADDLDKILLATACQLVSPKRVVAGTLRITPSQLHFSGEVADEDGSSSPREVRRCYRRWEVAAVREAHHMRFLLRPFALELFFGDRTNALLSFPSAKVMKDVAKQLHSLSGNILVFDRKRKQDAAQRLQQQWQRWEISNFDYLMQLNLLAGRTYNDLNQYPVFPWVLADYSSERLDLADPATFRDLAKPVGALAPKRLAFFRERFDSLRQDPGTPAFHYGSHYSSAGIVLFFLLRLEPFTRLNRALQGGRFDHADRLFHSVEETWQNSLHNSTDVKELTPEFFYQPEFLRNSDAFDLGCRQDGTRLADVVLPAWARGSPDEFIRMQREALESEHVSQHLHAWLDLVFGAAQRGKAAEEACNVFYHLTYEGAVDLDDIDDPFQRKAVEDQISFFGQTPSQLFTKRHPRRGPPPPPSTHPLLNCPEAMKLVVVAKPSTHRPNSAVARLAQCEGRLVLVNADRAVACHRWLSPRDLPAFTFSGMGDAGFNVEPDPAPARFLGTPFAADLDSGKCYCVLPGGQVIVSCGYWDNSVRCYSVDTGRLLQSVRQHKDLVTCLALASDGSTLVSGSRDTTVIIWDTAGIPRGGKPKGRVATLPLSPEPRHVLYGHSAAVSCVALCPQLDLVFSAGAEGGLLSHTISTGRHVARMQLPGNVAAAHLVAAAATARLVSHSHHDLGLHACSLTGRHIVSAECSERLAALAASPDGRFLLTCGAKGAITLRWLHSLQAVLRYDPQRGPLTALAVTDEECLLAGTSDGSLLVLAPDPRRTASRRLDLAADAAPNAAVPVIRFET